MGWIRWTGIALEFTGKLAQSASFDDWVVDQGKEIVEKVAGERGGYFLGIGAESRAKRFVWADLESIARQSPELDTSIRNFVRGYPNVLASVSVYTWSLPHVTSHLTVVPRFLVARDALAEAKEQLGTSEELAKLKGGPLLRDYFLRELIDQLDSTYSSAAGKATPDRPLKFSNKWVVGFSPRYEWSGHAGHYLVYSDYTRTNEDAGRKEKKQARKDATEQLAATLDWLGKLSPEQRRKLEDSLP